VTTHLSIGEFSQRTRLSQKALRIYGELGLVVPAFVEGIGGLPFVVFYGEVSADSDGPIELCRPVASAASAPEPNGGIQRRVEAAHDEAFIRLALKEMGWPPLLPACDALERWTKQNGREPAGALRQLLIADQRIPTPETLVCDLSVPLR
jgi:hypothetical protein